MKNKNILIISHLYPSPEKPTKGIFVHKQVKALIEAGYNVRVISPAVFGKGGGLKKYRVENVEVWAPRYLSASRFLAAYTGNTAYPGSIRAFRGMGFEPDIILAHTALPDGAIAQVMSKKLEIPYFVYVHGADVQHKINYNKQARRKIVSVLSGAKGVLVNSSKTQRLVKEIGIGSTIVPMGVTEVKAKSYKVIKSKQSTKIVRLISVCNLEEEKGVQFAIEALKEIKDKNIEYVIIGDGSYASDLRKMASADERIKFLGHQSQDRVFEELSRSDVFVLPSYNEAFGVAYLEAMSFGLPIIGVRGQGVDDIIAKGECGILVGPQSIDDCREAIARLIEDPKLRKKMGEVGKKIVNKYYLWNVVVKDLLRGINK